LSSQQALADYAYFRQGIHDMYKAGVCSALVSPSSSSFSRSRRSGLPLVEATRATLLRGSASNTRISLLQLLLRQLLSWQKKSELWNSVCSTFLFFGSTGLSRVLPGGCELSGSCMRRTRYASDEVN